MTLIPACRCEHWLVSRRQLFVLVFLLSIMALAPAKKKPGRKKNMLIPRRRRDYGREHLAKCSIFIFKKEASRRLDQAIAKTTIQLQVQPCLAAQSQWKGRDGRPLYGHFDRAVTKTTIQLRRVSRRRAREEAETRSLCTRQLQRWLPLHAQSSDDSSGNHLGKMSCADTSVSFIRSVLLTTREMTWWKNTLVICMHWWVDRYTFWPFMYYFRWRWRSG